MTNETPVHGSKHCTNGWNVDQYEIVIILSHFLYGHTLPLFNIDLLRLRTRGLTN